MSALTASLLRSFQDVCSITDSIKSAEKARVPALQAEATKRFNSAYRSYEQASAVCNTHSLTQSNHPELSLTVAEAAFASGQVATARLLLSRFFQSDPQVDQLYCRAKILLAQIVDAETKADKCVGSEALKRCHWALQEARAALEAALIPSVLSRYSFIAYNVSVVCWQIINPFLRAGRAKDFHPLLTQIVNALETAGTAPGAVAAAGTAEVGGKDDSMWRVMLLSACALCLFDDGKAKEATDCVDKAITVCQTQIKASLTLEDTCGISLNSARSESEKLLAALRRYHEREELRNKPPKLDPDTDDGFEVQPPAKEEPPLEGLDALPLETLETMLQKAQRVLAKAGDEWKVLTQSSTRPLLETMAKLYMQRINVMPSEAKKMQTSVPSFAPATPTAAAMSPSSSFSSRMKVLVGIQAVMSGCVLDKDLPPALQELEKDANACTDIGMKTESLLDISRLAWSLGETLDANPFFSFISLTRTLHHIT